MPDISLPGLIGAAIGGVIGILDFGLIVALVRNAVARFAQRDPSAQMPKGRLEAVLKGLFVINLLVFAGLGYWFGVTIGG